MSVLSDFWRFMKERKKFWLAPIIILLILLGFIIVFASGNAAGGFIYTIF